MNKKTVLNFIVLFLYFGLIIGVVLQLISCKSTGNNLITENSQKESQELQSVKNWISKQWPGNAATYKTTNSSVYLANLNSSIEVFNRLYNNQNKTSYGAQLASKLYLRYRILGDFNDATKALETIQTASQLSHTDANIHYTLAIIQSGFHQFKSALSSLETAMAMGGNNKQIALLKNEIRYSLGLYQPYDFIIKEPGTNNLTKAKYALLNNHFEQASHFYKNSMDNYNDTDPFKLSWLQLQQGIAFLRYGDPKTANLFFQAAHNRFPEYYLVTEHLAETEFLLGHLERAKNLYQLVIQQTNNPEFYAQLAKIESLLGNHQSSSKALLMAETEFDQLIELYPKALGDHAIQFYIDNQHFSTALNLAKINLDNRKNIESYELLIKTALANNDVKLACDTYMLALNYKVRPLEFIHLSNELSCENSPTNTQ